MMVCNFLSGLSMFFSMVIVMNQQEKTTPPNININVIHEYCCTCWIRCSFHARQGCLIGNHTVALKLLYFDPNYWMCWVRVHFLCQKGGEGCMRRVPLWFSNTCKKKNLPNHSKSVVCKLGLKSVGLTELSPVKKK